MALICDGFLLGSFPICATEYQCMYANLAHAALQNDRPWGIHNSKAY